MAGYRDGLPNSSYEIIDVMQDMNEGDYFLGRLEVPKDNTGGIEYIRPLLPEETEQILAAIKNLKDWLKSDADAFALDSHAYGSLKSRIAAIEEAFKSTPVPQQEEALLAINSDFLSYMSMMRLYTDHAGTKLKLGEDDMSATEFAVFSAASSKEFDKGFAYKFSYKIRNYSQHCGLPITGLKATGTLVPGTTDIEYEFDVRFVRDELLSKYDSWGNKVKPELEKQTEEFSVMPIIEEAYEAIMRIRDTTVKGFLPRLKDDIMTVDALLNAVEFNGVVPVVFKVKSNRPDGVGRKIEFEMTSLPVNLLAIASSYQE